MIQLRPSQDRGLFQNEWLKSHHTFSFGEYHDVRHMGFRDLRVINEDYVSAGRGFGTHPHRDMEIITYIVSGSLEHRDSMGTGSVIRPGDVQRMSAGTGVTHSEINPSSKENVHLLQIWIFPEKKGLSPSYEQKSFSEADRTDHLKLVASRDGRNGSVVVHQDANLYAAKFGAGKKAEHPLPSGRHAWVQVVRGAITLNGQELSEGDGAAISDERELSFQSARGAEILLFDLK